MKTLGYLMVILCYITMSCANYGGSGVSNTSNVKTITNGYDTQNAKNYTGSAEEVKGLGNNITLDNYLRRVSGVNVQGDGANAKITIRGINSFVSDPTPLFVINGSAINGGYSSVYSMVNPNDIKSVNVLKDAASTAIYGSRAANGVIVISLKKGEY
jgi:TonB-dependent starch-binding outer membrane protein SusC